MLQVLTSDEFAEWFRALDDRAAEEVATALEVTEQLGPERSLPASHEWLLWYEHPRMARWRRGRTLRLDFDLWLSFHEYARRVVAQLESPRFMSRISRLPADDASAVLTAIERIRQSCDPRPHVLRARIFGAPQLADARGEVRRWYLTALAAAGLEVRDVPAHSAALREFSLRSIGPGLRLLYGVDTEREMALFVLGEWLNRSCYGDAVRRAEKMWKQFLAGKLRAPAREPAR